MKINVNEIGNTHDEEDDEDTAEFFASLPLKPREI